jgi:N-methylhydantoinase A/oxoprolinase/acetone carboxylase beta subunit
VRALGIVSIAVVFAHAYTFPDHEQQVRWIVLRSVCHLRSFRPACGWFDVDIHSGHVTSWCTGVGQVRVIAEGLGFTQISLSSAVMPMVKMVARGFTTTADRCEGDWLSV